MKNTETKSNIAKELELAGMDTADLAEKMGLKETAVKDWLDDPTQIRARYLLQMAEMFGCTIEYLIAEEAPRSMYSFPCESKLEDLATKADALSQTLTGEWEGMRAALMHAAKKGDTPPAYIEYAVQHDIDRHIALEYMLQNLICEINALVCGSDDETQE